MIGLLGGNNSSTVLENAVVLEDKNWFGGISKSIFLGLIYHLLLF
jgi:hypothetical protein